MKKIRVLVVDDSAFMRKLISDILANDHRIQVIGIAKNGQDALQKIKQLRPDVVTLDIEMPVLDGIATLKKIMQTTPLPVVIVSGITKDHTEKTVQAISLGATDVITKPSGPISLNLEMIKDEVIDKVITASQANIHKTHKNKLAHFDNGALKKHHPTIIAIGASTGGPRALERLLRDLPKNVKAPILIVQHMPSHFTKSLAKRLDQVTNIPVNEARHGEILQKGNAYIAPGNYHMMVRKVGREIEIHLTKSPPKNSHRPSVDILFQSLVALKNYNKIAVILTGMGRDGAEGITYLKENDRQTFVITESGQSALINGMPRAAEKTGYVNVSTHLDHIGNVIKENIY